ncbi:MAG: family 20 glycosylhydrolase [Haloechinothrix sp.]
MTVHFDRRAMLKALALGGALAMAPGWAYAAGVDTARPWTIPALREWRPASGTFTLGSPARIVLTPADAQALSATAAVFAEDLRSLLGSAVQVVARGGAPKRGEIQLRLGANDPIVGSEGYRMEVGPATVITANAAADVFYGTRSILQLLAQDQPVPAGVALDWPRYAERGLMVDIGRKYFSIEWLRARVRELAYLKLNYLHLHFTEDLGWRIESDRGLHPDRDYLTKQQVRELIELAARHHITVVPEVDMPGHMGAALADRPELQLVDMFDRANPGKLDFTLPDARQFARELVEEYLPLFPGPYWHMGADEFLPAAEYPLYPQLARYGRERYGGNAKDGVLGFINEINDLVRARGKTLRTWADGLGGGDKVRVNSDVIVEWWTDFSPLSDLVSLPTPEGLLADGHRINNSSWYPTYYSATPGGLPPKPDLEGMYETWAVHRFRGVLCVNGDIGTPYHDISPREPDNLGSKLHVWNDDPDAETEAEIAVGIFDRLRVMAQKTWESPPVAATWADFRQVIATVGAPPAG